MVRAARLYQPGRTFSILALQEAVVHFARSEGGVRRTPPAQEPLRGAVWRLLELAVAEACPDGEEPPDDAHAALLVVGIQAWLTSEGWS